MRRKAADLQCQECGMAMYIGRVQDKSGVADNLKEWVQILSIVTREDKYHPVTQAHFVLQAHNPGKGETAIQQTLRPFKHWRGPISTGQRVNTRTG